MEIKKRKKSFRESDFQRLFTKWVNENKYSNTAVFELKISKGKSLSIDRIRDHQIVSLMKSKHDFLFHKISDMPSFSSIKKETGKKEMRFQRPKPFDCFVVSQCESYLVVLFYEPRKPKTMYWIDIDDLNFLIKSERALGRKSIKKESFMQIAKKTINFGDKNEENKTF